MHIQGAHLNDFWFFGAGICFIQMPPIKGTTAPQQQQLQQQRTIDSNDGNQSRVFF